MYNEDEGCDTMLKSALRFSHELLAQTVQPGDIVVDATVGNGHDTVKLAQLVGKTGKVYGFDIQKQAIEETKKKILLTGLADQVELHQTGHEEMDMIVSEENLSAVVFNLGYLPKGDKSIITQPTTTLQAISHSLKRLKRSGIVLLMIYHGHEGGKEEKNAVIDFVQELPQQEYSVLQYGFINQKNSPPFLVAIEKK
jgi:predicted methyltransferase